MKRIFTLFISTVIAATMLSAQEMPDTLKQQLKAQSQKLNPDNEAGAKSWYRKQKSSWETIQNMSFSIDESDVKLLKEAAEKKFPLDFTKQETYLTETSQAIADTAEFKTQLGADAYSALKKKAITEGNLSILTENIAKQVAAKAKIDAISSDKVDAMTLTITKEVIAKKFPGDFVSQYEALKKQLKLDDNTPASTTTVATETPDASKSETKESDSSEPTRTRPITMGELNKKAREIFNAQSFNVESEKNCTALAMEIAGKQVLLLPFTSYVPGSSMSIMNNLGETVEYNPEEIYASKDIPLMVVFPTSMPEGVKNAKLITDKEYREIINKNIFFVGSQKGNIITFPVRITALSNAYLNLSTRVPTNFNEGTMIIDPTNDTTVGFLVGGRGELPEIDWTQRSEINRLNRLLERPIENLTCVRINKLGKLEKIDPEVFKEQKKKLDSIKQLNDDFIFYFTNNRMKDSVNRQKLGPVIKKHIGAFSRRMEISRFERMYRAFLQDVIIMIKAELKGVKVSDFYSVFRSEAQQSIKILTTIQKTFQDASKSGAYKRMLHNDIKRAQDMDD